VDIFMDIEEDARDFAGLMEVTPALFFDNIFKILKEHLELHVKSINISDGWRELTVVCNSKPGKNYDFVKERAQEAVEEINEYYMLETSINAYIRRWATKNVEIYISYRR